MVYKVGNINSFADCISKIKEGLIATNTFVEEYIISNTVYVFKTTWSNGYIRLSISTSTSSGFFIIHYFPSFVTGFPTSSLEAVPIKTTASFLTLGRMDLFMTETFIYFSSIQTNTTIQVSYIFGKLEDNRIYFICEGASVSDSCCYIVGDNRIGCVNMSFSTFNASNLTNQNDENIAIDVYFVDITTSTIVYSLSFPDAPVVAKDLKLIIKDKDISSFFIIEHVDGYELKNGNFSVLTGQNPTNPYFYIKKEGE